MRKKGFSHRRYSISGLCRNKQCCHRFDKNKSVVLVHDKRLDFLIWKSSLNLSGQQDLNLRPHGPQPCALPSYAIPRDQQMLLYQNFFKNQHFFRKFFGLEPKYFRKAPEKCSGEEYPRAVDTEVTVWPGCPRRTRARSIRAWVRFSRKVCP